MLRPSQGGYSEMAVIHCDVGPANGVIDGNVVYNLDPANTGKLAIGLLIEDACNGWMVKNNTVHDVGWSAGRNKPNQSGPRKSLVRQ
jgi:hypothetical protein